MNDMQNLIFYNKKTIFVYLTFLELIIFSISYLTFGILFLVIYIIYRNYLS